MSVKFGELHSLDNVRKLPKLTDWQISTENGNQPNFEFSSGYAQKFDLADAEYGRLREPTEADLFFCISSLKYSYVNC